MDKRLIIAGAIVLVLILIIGILSISRPRQTAYNTTTTTNITLSTSVLPPPLINGAEVQAIMGTSGLSSSFSAYEKYNYTGQYSCNSTITAEFFFEPPLNGSATPFNFSKLDEAVPFEVYLALWRVNSSYAYEYNSIFTANGGYCNPTLAPLLGNATFTTQPITLDNRSGYLMSFSNFTETGLNLTSNPYLGKKPNVVFYETSFLVANLRVSVAEFGFAGHTSPALAINDTEGPLKQAVQFAQSSG